MKKRARAAISATDLIAERERRMRDDPDYRAQVEAAEDQRAARARAARQAEQPILRELADVGIDVDSVWDLPKSPTLQLKAFPVLLSHLACDYSDRVVDGIGAALGREAARAHWSEMKALYRQADNSHVRDRLAAVMSDCAIRTHYEDLLSFIQDDELGETRIYFLRPINRIGNRIKPGTGRAVISSLIDDPTMGKEARAILTGRGPNE